jgi:hypothetical protein
MKSVDISNWARDNILLPLYARDSTNRVTKAPAVPVAAASYATVTLPTPHCTRRTNDAVASSTVPDNTAIALPVAVIPVTGIACVAPAATATTDTLPLPIDTVEADRLDAAIAPGTYRPLWAAPVWIELILYILCAENV